MAYIENNGKNVEVAKDFKKEYEARKNELHFAKFNLQKLTESPNNREKQQNIKKAETIATAANRNFKEIHKQFLNQYVDVEQPSQTAKNISPENGKQQGRNKNVKEKSFYDNVAKYGGALQNVGEESINKYLKAEKKVEDAKHHREKALEAFNQTPDASNQTKKDALTKNLDGIVRRAEKYLDFTLKEIVEFNRESKQSAENVSTVIEKPKQEVKDEKDGKAVINLRNSRPNKRTAKPKPKAAPTAKDIKTSDTAKATKEPDWYGQAVTPMPAKNPLEAFLLPKFPKGLVRRANPFKPKLDNKEQNKKNKKNNKGRGI